MKLNDRKMSDIHATKNSAVYSKCDTICSQHTRVSSSEKNKNKKKPLTTVSFDPPVRYVKIHLGISAERERDPVICIKSAQQRRSPSCPLCFPLRGLRVRFLSDVLLFTLNVMTET